MYDILLHLCSFNFKICSDYEYFIQDLLIDLLIGNILFFSNNKRLNKQTG